MIRHYRFVIITLLLAVLGGTAPGQEYTIKFATFAPEGSSWMNVMKEFDQAIRKESGGRLGFKIYAGGVQGDEKDYIRKIKLGQLHSAGVTGNGLTTVAPIARILDAPFLLRSEAEADFLHAQFDREFNAAMEQNGFVNIGWVEVGFVYVYSSAAIRSPQDMSGVRMWMWEGDPIAEAAFSSLGVHPVPLSITDVMTSLQTGLINGVYATPYACVALQWFLRVKQMLNLPLADASGAVIISKKKFDEIPKALQEILLRNGQTYLRKLTTQNRQDNAKAVETLRANGITVNNPPSAAAVQSYEETGRKARLMLVGKLYSKDLLDRVEGALGSFRSRKTQ